MFTGLIYLKGSCVRIEYNAMYVHNTTDEVNTAQESQISCIYLFQVKEGLIFDPSIISTI